MRPRLPPFLCCLALPILIGAAFYTSSAHAAPLHLTPKEASAYAYHVGGSTLVAIIRTESSMCRYRIGDDGSSLGCGQLKLQTARIFAPHITRWRLIHDDRLNIRLAWRYFQSAEAETGNWTAAVYAYNHGIPRTRHTTWRRLLADSYVQAIEGGYTPCCSSGR